MSDDGVKKSGWFKRLTKGLSRSASKLGDGIAGIFTSGKLTDDQLEDLEDLLITADLGVRTAAAVTETLAAEKLGRDVTVDDVKAVLAEKVADRLEPVARPLEINPAHGPHVILVAGVNGVGKTTTIGKLAKALGNQGHKVMLAAGDTFRAAAIEQLVIWGERNNVPVISSKVGADAAGLAFDALDRAEEAKADVLLIDTAGRLQNKADLMDELAKVHRVLSKRKPGAPHDVVLVLDATTGQNALAQIEVFRAMVNVTGLVMTKLDGTARGGVLVAAADKFELPIHAIGVGEAIDDLRPFDAQEFAKSLVGIVD